MNKVKVVHTKETIMASNNFTEAIIQNQSNGKIGKMPQNHSAHPQKNTHADVQIQEAITLKSQVCICAVSQNPLHAFRSFPLIETPWGNCL